MQIFRRIIMLFLLPGLIWVLSSACGLGSTESSPEEAATEEVPSDESALQTNEQATTPEPTTQQQVVADQQESFEPREATTVFAAAQILDLRGLSLPTEINSMGQNEVGLLSFELPTDDIISAVELYQSEFIKQGWQNDSDQEYTDEITAYRYFRKDGFLVSLSASQVSGSTLMTFTNHGNTDLRALPQMVGAEPLFQSPNTLGYLASAEVSEVADFTRQELAAQGWQEFTLPGTATANDADLQSLMFIQNGLELSVLIGVAPAQGNKTSVQYSATLLPLDLPIDVTANDLEFDKHTPYLHYQSTTDIETLTDYYLEEMSGLGWEELSEITNIGPVQTTLFFLGQRLHANDSGQMTVMLEVAPIDGETSVTLQQVDAEEIYAFQEGGIEDDSLTANDATATEMPNLPIPEDALDVVYDADFGEITFTSSSDIETLVEFYREMLLADGWQEDEDFSFVDETFASLDFTRDETTVTIDLFDDLDGGTEANLYGYGPLWEAVTGTDTDTASNSPEELTLVENSGFLIPSDYTEFYSEGSQFSEIATVYTPSDFETLVELYERELPNFGGNLHGYIIQEISENYLYITKPEGDLYITTQSVGGETEMKITCKNIEAATEAGILPANGQGRIYLGNILETGDIIVNIEGQDISVPPSDPMAESPDEFEYVELAPGAYPITITLPDGSTISDEVEAKADSVVMLLLDTEGVWPLVIY